MLSLLRWAAISRPFYRHRVGEAGVVVPLRS